MARFGKTAVLAYLRDGIDKLVAKNCFDLSQDSSQLIGKLDTTEAKCDYGALRFYEELVRVCESKDFNFKKSTFESYLDARRKDIQDQFQFDLGNGTAQLKGRRFGTIEAHIAYWTLRSCERLKYISNW